MKLDIAIPEFSPGIGRKGRAVGIPVKQLKSFDIWKTEHPL